MEHGGEIPTKSITLLMQASYSIGYIPEEWKRENKIYIQKQTKQTTIKKIHVDHSPY